MLATDLHNTSIKNKMTKPDWLKNNSKNNGGKDYDKELLLGIYERIAAERLRLGGDGSVGADRPEQKSLDQLFKERFALSDELVLRGDTSFLPSPSPLLTFSLLTVSPIPLSVTIVIMIIHFSYLFSLSPLFSFLLLRIRVHV